jgi:hypothetical protein
MEHRAGIEPANTGFADPFILYLSVTYMENPILTNP